MKKDCSGGNTRVVRSTRSAARVTRKKAKPGFHLYLIISREELDWKGYDLDNAKPWPLGSYNSEKEAVAVRNSLVLIKGVPIT